MGAREQPSVRGTAMRISTAFPSKWLKAADLNGRPVTVTMSHVVMEDVSGTGDPQPVLYFQGKDKGMVLNKTNGYKIAEIFGDDTKEWTGRQIVLFEAMVSFQGRTVPGLRVRIAPNNDQPRQQASNKTSAEIIDDDVPF